MVRTLPSRWLESHTVTAASLPCFTRHPYIRILFAYRSALRDNGDCDAPTTTVYQIPDSTRCCSESACYVRISCLIVGQRGAVWEQLCNYCATRISALYRFDVRPSRAQTMKRLADFRPSDVPFGGLQISRYTRVYCYLSPSAPRKRSTPISLPGDGHRARQQNTNDPRAAWAA